MKATLEKLFEGFSLTYDEAYDTLIQIGQGEFTDTQKSAFLSVYAMRMPTLSELRGFKTAMLELAVPIPEQQESMIDVCGTGGDEKNTFNISTATAFVLAAAGLKVAKHGNYSVSSFCGSSNVLEEIGIRFPESADQVLSDIDTYNIAFIHAPLFHPAMRHIAPLRLSLIHI